MHYKMNKLVRLIALLYAARKCKQNKRYHTSARLTLAYKKIPHVRKVNYFRSRDGRTDRRTDRQSATQYAAPSYGGGPHNK